jgi:hypothetical protein
LDGYLIIRASVKIEDLYLVCLQPKACLLVLETSFGGFLTFPQSNTETTRPKKFGLFQGLDGFLSSMDGALRNPGLAAGCKKFPKSDTH